MTTDQRLMRKSDTSGSNYINKHVFNKSDPKNHIADELPMHF